MYWKLYVRGTLVIVNINQSKEIFKLKVVPQLLFSDLKFISHELLVLFRLAKEVD